MSPEATELTLYLDNEEPLCRQKTAIFRALAKKKDRGKYNHALADTAQRRRAASRRAAPPHARAPGRA